MFLGFLEAATVQAGRHDEEVVVSTMRLVALRRQQIADLSERPTMIEVSCYDGIGPS